VQTRLTVELVPSTCRYTNSPQPRPRRRCGTGCAAGSPPKPVTAARSAALGAGAGRSNATRSGTTTTIARSSGSSGSSPSARPATRSSPPTWQLSGPAGGVVAGQGRRGGQRAQDEGKGGPGRAAPYAGQPPRTGGSQQPAPTAPTRVAFVGNPGFFSPITTGGRRGRRRPVPADEPFSRHGRLRRWSTGALSARFGGGSPTAV